MAEYEPSAPPPPQALNPGNPWANRTGIWQQAVIDAKASPGQWFRKAVKARGNVGPLQKHIRDGNLPMTTATRVIDGQIWMYWVWNEDQD